MRSPPPKVPPLPMSSAGSASFSAIGMAAPPESPEPKEKVKSRDHVAKGATPQASKPAQKNVAAASPAPKAPAAAAMPRGSAAAKALPELVQCYREGRETPAMAKFLSGCNDLIVNICAPVLTRKV